MNKAPDWVKNLSAGDAIVIVFPYTGYTIFAEVTKNNPTLESSLYFGTISIKYKDRSTEREEDLLYDYYCKETDSMENWFAYPVI
jgi:hypothetical protein